MSDYRIVGHAGLAPQGGVRRELWLEQELPEGWVAAMRVVDQDGRPVVAELRVIPDASPRDSTSRHAGRWSEDASDVPLGGLKQRGVLRCVRLGAVAQQMAALMAQADYGGSGSTTGHFADFADRLRASFGARSEWSDQKHPQGRRPLAPEELARIARDYVDLVEAGVSTPVEALAEKYRLAPSTARSRLKRARDLGIFQGTGRRGIPGGVVTPYGRSLLGDGAGEGGET